jgi:hypothetical protein
VGTTADPCGYLPNLTAQTHSNNGAIGVGYSGSNVYQLAEGRMGTDAQLVFATVNGHSSPWLWSVINFALGGPNGTVSSKSMYPTHSIYIDGTLSSTSTPNFSGFVSSDDTYQMIPSNIP